MKLTKRNIDSLAILGLFILALIICYASMLKPAKSDYYTINATRIQIKVLEGNLPADTFKIDDQKCLKIILPYGGMMSCWKDNGSPI